MGRSISQPSKHGSRFCDVAPRRKSARKPNVSRGTSRGGHRVGYGRSGRGFASGRRARSAARATATDPARLPTGKRRPDVCVSRCRSLCERYPGSARLSVERRSPCLPAGARDRDALGRPDRRRARRLAVTAPAGPAKLAKATHARQAPAITTARASCSASSSGRGAEMTKAVAKARPTKFSVPGSTRWATPP
jgi:hypothetical protein